jgi:uncharacterized membrane protein YhaH (DUF805 family)
MKKPYLDNLPQDEREILNVVIYKISGKENDLTKEELDRLIWDEVKIKGNFEDWQIHYTVQRIVKALEDSGKRKRFIKSLLQKKREQDEDLEYLGLRRILRDIFRGRINRLQFFTRNIMLLSIILVFCVLPLFLIDFFPLYYFLDRFINVILIICGIYSFSLKVRRCHDFNFGGLWAVAFILAPFVLLFIPGEEYENKYGEVSDIKNDYLITSTLKSFKRISLLIESL